MKSIDQKVADLIASFNTIDTHEIDDINLPGSKNFFGLLDVNHRKYEGTIIGQWKLQKLLAKGGMSLVFLVCRNVGGFEQKAAMKIITNTNVTQSNIKRFHRERQILTRLNHPNITKIFDGGITDDGQQWYVMEHINGVDVVEYVKKNRLDYATILRLFLQICEAVAYSHQHDIVHRDLKPANIHVDDNGHIKLFDFGIAHHMELDLSLTKTGSVLGTPGYMSPEQIRGESIIDGRSDIFSLGILLCELLYQKKPFTGDSLTDISHKILHEPININLSKLDKDLKTIILKCLRKQKPHRYADVTLLKNDIHAYLNHEVISAKTISFSYKVSKLLSKYPKISVSLISLSFLLCASIVYSYAQASANNQKLLITEKIIAQVKNMESSMRRTHMMPLHNIETVYQNNLIKTKKLQQSIKNSSLANNAMSHNLLGQAYVNLRQYETALQHFNNAQSLGFRSEDFDRGYALSLIHTWNQQQEQLKKISNKEQKQELTEKIKKELYLPMISAIKKIEKKHHLYSFLAAHQAYLEQDYSQALTHLDSTIAQYPWYYEAIRMKSEVLLKQLAQMYRQQGATAALKHLDTGKKLLHQAIAIGRSDPLNYNLLCTTIATEVQIYRAQNQLTTKKDLMDQAEEICQSALTLDKTAQAPWTNLAQINLAIAFEKSDQDPEKKQLYKTTIDSLSQAHKLHPENIDIATKLAETTTMLALTHIQQGEDPMALFEHSEKILIPLSHKYPEYNKTWTELARVSSEKGNYLKDKDDHLTASTHYIKAIEYLDTSYKLTQSNVAKLNIALLKTLLYETNKEQSNYPQAVKYLNDSLDISFQLSKRYYSQLGDFARLIQLNGELIDLKSQQQTLTGQDISTFNQRLVVACQDTKDQPKSSRELNLMISQMNNKGLKSIKTIKQCS